MKNTLKPKLCILAALITCLLSASSCKKAANMEGTSTGSLIAGNQISAENGILKFASQQQLNDFINEAKKQKNPQYIDLQIGAQVNDGTFKSFYSVYKTLDGLAESNPDEFNQAVKKYPQVNSEDEILNDDYFCRLVNENKEIIVNGSLYKISKAGVLVLGDKDINNYIKSTKGTNGVSSSESFIKTQKYKALASAKFFSTATLNPKIRLKSSNAISRPHSELFEDESYSQLNDDGTYLSNYEEREQFSDDGGGGGGSDGGGSDGGSSSISYALDNNYTANPGCDIVYQDYSNEREYRVFPHNNKARLKVKFWSNNYYIYKTIGIKVVVQKQTSAWFDWWGSFEHHDYAKANINHLTYRIKEKDFFPAATNTTTPSFGGLASSFLKSAVKVQVTGDLDILAFDLRDLAQTGALSWLLNRIPVNYSTPENILSEVINNQTGQLSDKIFAALDKELGPEFQGKKIQKGLYYTPVGENEPILVIQNREYATYGSGIIDETLVKEWQGFLAGIGTDASGKNLGVTSFKILDVSDIEVLKVDLVGSGSLDGHCIGIGMRK